MPSIIIGGIFLFNKNMLTFDDQTGYNIKCLIGQTSKPSFNPRS